ncbi:MAG TPA: PAS domain S-box protein [Blastocatellia bacterium]|nr:PAS domain S-box protein [Blastocatellia bacterium]
METDELEVLVAKRTAELLTLNAQLRAELAESKRKEEALRLSEQRQRLALSASNTGLWDWDIRSNEIFFSREWKAQIGYEDQEIENRKDEWESRVHPDDRDRLFANVDAYLANPWSNFEVEYRLRHKDGSYKWILSRATMFPDKEHNPERMLGSHLDITDRKLAEDALRTSELRYRTLAHNFPNGGVALFDRDLRFMIADGTDLARVGLSKEKLEGRTIWEVFSPEVADALEPAYRAALEGRTTVDEVHLRGSVYLRHAVPVTDAHGEIVAGMLMSQDITERKRAEEALRREELEYRSLVESVLAIVWRADAPTFQFSFVSKEAEALLGYPAERWIADSTFWRDHLHPDDRDWVVSFRTNAVYEKKDYVSEYRMIAADGKVVWLREMVRVVIEHGALKELVGVMVDITERKLAEEARHQSETKFTTVFETIPDPVMIVRLRDWLVLDVNQAWTGHTGYPKSERVGTTNEHLDLLVEPGDRDRFVALVRETGEAKNFDFMFRTKEGSLRHALVSARRVELDGEQCAVAVVKDVTEHKEAEDALRRSEERYRLIVENQTEFIVKSLPDGTRTFVNDSYCRYFGLTEEECLGTSFFTLVDPGFREAIHQRTAALTLDAPEYTEEHQSIVPQGLRWQQWTTRGIFDADGKLIELLSSGRDVTERKAAEEALQESESLGRTLNERFALAVDSAGIGVWDLNILTNNLTWDQQMNRLYRIEQEQLGAYELWLSRVHLDDRVRAHDEVQLAIKGLKPFDTDFRIVWPNGEWRHIKAFARVVRNERGTPVRMTGINYDITDRKRAEESLERSEAHYRALVENTPDIIARFDRDCRYMFVNTAIAQVSLLKPEEFEGKSLREVGFSGEEASFREEVIREVFETKKPFESEFEFEGPHGLRVFEWRAFPEFDEKGNTHSVLSINRDVTERRHAEQQLKESREQLRALSAHLQSVREEERTVIAREIHDELGQALTGLKMDLSYLQKTLTRVKTSELDRLTDTTVSMSKLVDATIQTVRKIATDLRPGILDDLGLVAAIEWQAQDFQKRTGITCKFSPGVDDLDIDRDRSTASFRIFQETLTNVARHSGASAVAVSLDRRGDALALEIKDNGKGISEADISGRGSLGLLGMRERAQLLGGELKISGAPGEGTTVIVRIPLA